MFWSSDAATQWQVLPPPVLALVLYAVIGIEREFAAKAAGLRAGMGVGDVD